MVNFVDTAMAATVLNLILCSIFVNVQDLSNSVTTFALKIGLLLVPKLKFQIVTNILNMISVVKFVNKGSIGQSNIREKNIYFTVKA